MRSIHWRLSYKRSLFNSQFPLTRNHPYAGQRCGRVDENAQPPIPRDMLATPPSPIGLLRLGEQIGGSIFRR